MNEGWFMNTYDKAHELANAIKASEHYSRLLIAQKAIADDTTAKKMVEHF